MLDGGASPEFALGDAYNSGHVNGSAVRSLTDAETDLAEAARLLTEYQVQLISDHISPEFAALVEAIREPEEETTIAHNPKRYGHGHD